MDYSNGINNTVTLGTVNVIRQKKKQTEEVKRPRSSGVLFVSKLREEIEADVREEYERKLADFLFGGSIPAKQPALSREEYIIQQKKIIDKQYKQILALCDNSVTETKIITEMPIVKRLYGQC